MARPCSICTHPDRTQIDAALVAGEAFRNVSKRWGMSAAAAFRHSNEHIGEQVAKAAKATEVEDVKAGLDVVKQLAAINSAALTVLRDARVAGDGRLQLLAIDRIQRQLELQAKLIGELDERPVINILASPEWVMVRTAMLEELRPFPEARVAVAARLRVLDPRC